MIGVTEDDLRVIAKHGYEGVLSTDPEQRAQTLSLFIARHARRSSGAVTALRQLQRRFSKGVTTVAT